jgi:hypothetical protein
VSDRPPGVPPGVPARAGPDRHRSGVVPARTYRIRLALRVACALAALFWAGMLVAVLRLPGAGAEAALGAGGFVAFFAASSLLYARTWIAVGPEGIVVASPLRRRPVPFSEVLGVVVRDGPAGRVYAVLTPRGPVRFTSLLAHHRELFETLLARSGLSPRTA